ncbi:glycerol uptake facilitator protein [Liquorilactobacillus sucicola DSM 21376 = JCM 15457]|nr:MIP/aquaporin family protein [Liquorilactobacillus sucicola]GAJ26895.1 glycerol uptake facilitator protein [Liquorilactobacillus sucicola DSM 21376 = JCM 15457]
MNSIPVQALGEFIGTFILVLLGDGVCAGVNLTKSKANNSGWVVISLGWGFAVTMGIYTSAFLGPAHLNPAVTIGMALANKFPWSGVLLFIIAQMLGAFLGALLVWVHYLPHWQATKDKELILGTFATGPAIRNYFANFMSEVIGTFVLVFSLLAFTRGQFTAGLTPVIVGILIIAIGLSLGGTTGYAINPARDLAPRLAHALLPIKNKGGSDWKYSWVPVLGPVVGGILGAVLFIILP